MMNGEFVTNLPPSASKLERVLEQIFWEEIGLIERDIRDFLNPWACREDLLPYLAWELSVDDWDDSWPIETKRRVCATALDIHIYKGTRYAIDKSIEAIRADSLKAVEWFEDEENLIPGQFRVDLISEQSPVDASTVPEIVRAIQHSKNTRSRLVGVSIKSRVENPEKHISMSRQALQVRSGPWKISSMVSSSSSAMACLSRVAVVVRSGPLPLVLE
ncbi:TPA: phage tail protein I [Vibrio vulnificus]|nr:phage tail protein I [Vibrio vulnificus]EHU4867397.1 phage tail protein I [Vibrio vulnificus]ELH4867443.1 phage tail protein I [Vibrio vulnificus]MCU8568529.1 phage tail protein I [Vibrio vulnificus]HAS8198227.1 phage tail protein I [Vibrio vulnificus]